MTETTQLEPGQRFAGKYVIERFVGKGGMSTVYGARNLVLQSRVALKVLTDELACVPAAVERFVREGVVASRVRHRAVVQVYDAGEDGGRPWIAMEYVDGESLADVYKARGPLPPDEVLRIGREVAEGLAAAHDQGVIHRDLKPHNVVLDRSEDPPQPKILDFGIAKLGDPGKPKLTQTGMLMGTPHYMSPEQARGEADVGPAADLWALGVILLEGLCGEMPYEADSVAVYLGKLVTAAPRDVRALAPAAPEPVVRVVEWCLRPDPAARPASARELAAELDRARLAIAGAAPEAARPPRAAPGPSRRWEVLALAAAAFALNATCVAGLVGLGRASCGGEAPEVAARVAPAAAGPGPAAPEAPPRSPVLVDSDPQGARILVNGLESGAITPATLPLAPGDHVEARLGPASASRLVEPGASGLFLDLGRAGRWEKGGHREKGGRWEKAGRQKRKRGRDDED